MLGLGLGGLLTHLLHARSATRRSDIHLVRYGLLTSASIPITVAGIVLMSGQAALYDQVFGYFAIVLLPFLASGMFFAELYRQHSKHSSRLYAYDLLGAAAGGGMAVLILNAWGAVASTLFLSALVALATYTLTLASGTKMRRSGMWAFSLLLASLAATLAFSTDGIKSGIPETLNPDKEIYDAINGPWGGEITDTRWTAFGRTQLITYRDNPEHRDIYVDGTAGTPMYQFSGDFSQPGPAVERLLAHFPGAVPFQFMPDSSRDKALIIGPGGGRDILLAAGAGFKNIQAAEVNPDLLDLVREHADYNGGLYTDFDHIDVHLAEGRHFIQRDQSLYDLIMMSLPVTNTSRSREGFSLTEDYLLTQQAIGDYLDHLTDQGQLVVITHDELAVVRLLRIALDAMAERGLETTTAMQHLYVLGSFPYPIVVISKQAFTPEIARNIITLAYRKDYSIAASYVPHLFQQGAGNPMLQAVAQGRLSVPGMVEFIAGHGHDISTVTDDRPFFYKTDPGLPQSLQLLAGTALFAALAALGLPTAFGLRRPDRLASESGRTRQRFVRAPLIFALLGTGFMLVEISLLQRLTFFLGEPVLALAVLLGALLVFMGAGSLISSRIPLRRSNLAVAIAGIAIAALLVGYRFTLPGILQALLTYNLAVRVLAAIALIMPLGIFLGSPFPMALRSLHRDGASWSVPWMWAVNGVFSVLGATAAVVLAMTYGMETVLLAAAGSYLLLAGVAAGGRP